MTHRLILGLFVLPHLPPLGFLIALVRVYPRILGYKMVVEKLRKKFLEKRVNKLAGLFNLEGLSVLDLGGYDGRYMDALKLRFPGMQVIIADYDPKGLEISQRKGYKTVHLDGSKRLPFPDKCFDLVFCNSVIEHVTIPKSEVWETYSTADFRNQSLAIQHYFASEITRIGKSYFVQTPNKYFIIEHHSWLPLVQFIPRKQQIQFLRFMNSFWIKKTAPDWNLLSLNDMKSLFPDGNVMSEKFLFMNKSLIAYKQ